MKLPGILLAIVWFAAITAWTTPALAEGALEPPAAPGTTGADRLALDYVDVGIHGGPAWRGNLGDQRFSALGVGLGLTIDIGRAPYWLGIYSDVAIINAKDGVVDPTNNERPGLEAISAGGRAKVAVRLSPNIYLFPSLGAGFGQVDYFSGDCPLPHMNCNDAKFNGLALQADATLAYTWRFAALTLVPMRTTAFLFEHRASPMSPNPPGYSYGVPGSALLLGASVGLSLDLSAMAIGIWSALKGVAAGVSAAATSL
jgi:hypothetical protein